VTQPKIVVLDGYTTNPGDLSWDPLQQLGQLTVYDRTEQSEVVNRLQGVDLALTNKVLLPQEILSALPALKYIGILATGTNAVDLSAAAGQSIVVCNVPRYSTDSVAQLVIEALLDAATHAGAHRAAVQSGAWANGPDFCFNVATVRELKGMTLGIVGYGTIGRRVAEVASALGMNLLIAESLNGAPSAAKGDPKREPLASVLQHSDFVTLHCPLTARTRGIIGQKELELMKATAILINTARGPLIDEAALALALNQGQIAGAYLDVLSEEPPLPGDPLLHHPKCKITPHIGWTSREARERLLAVSAQNIEAFLLNKPINVVN